MAGSERLTVACVLRSGGGYDGSWVAKLRNGVARHLSLPYRFVCLSDMEVPCERVEITQPWRGWWSKIGLFDVFKGPTLYLDLDSIIVGSLDAIASYPHEFTMTHEFYRPTMMCSTAMAWNGDFSFIARAFAESPNAIARRYDNHVRPRIGDQAFIEDRLRDRKVETFRDLFGERAIASYKFHHCEHAPPADAAVVAMHGRPKPSEIRTGWVPKAWR